MKRDLFFCPEWRVLLVDFYYWLNHFRVEKATAVDRSQRQDEIIKLDYLSFNFLLEILIEKCQCIGWNEVLFGD